MSSQYPDFKIRVFVLALFVAIVILVSTVAWYGQKTWTDTAIVTDIQESPYFDGVWKYVTTVTFNSTSHGVIVLTDTARSFGLYYGLHDMHLYVGQVVGIYQINTGEIKVVPQ